MEITQTTLIPITQTDIDNRRNQNPISYALSSDQDIEEEIRKEIEKELNKESLQKQEEARKEEESKNPPQFQYDKTLDGWKLLEPGPKHYGEPLTPELVGFLKQGETSIKGEEMLKRAKELGINSGQQYAEYLLKHQELIPEEWRGKYVPIFPGTVWQDQDPDGDRRVPYLIWGEGRWRLNFGWLGRSWGGGGRLVRQRGP